MTTHTDALPERDPSKPAEQQGLFRKFIVTRTDGSSEPGGKHEHCEYFVLDTTHDKLARVALQAYADACDATHPELSLDLRRRYGLTALPAEPRQPAAAVHPPEHCPACGYELTAAPQAAEPVAKVVRDGASVRLEWASVEAAHNAPVGPLYAPTAAQQPPIPPVDHGPVIVAPATQKRPALVTAMQGLLASLSRAPIEFELRAAAHEFTVLADRAAAAARAGGDDA